MHYLHLRLHNHFIRLHNEKVMVYAIVVIGSHHASVFHTLLAHLLPLFNSVITADLMAGTLFCVIQWPAYKFGIKDV